MNSSENLLNKLRQRRNRAQVPERPDPIIALQPNLEEPKSKSPNSPNSKSVEDTINELKEQLNTYPTTVRRSAIVLEQDIEKQLKQFCSDNNITIEVFLEAAWQISKQHRGLQKEITDEAQIRYRRRKEVGRLKRLITQLHNQTQIT